GQGLWPRGGALPVGCEGRGGRRLALPADPAPLLPGYRAAAAVLARQSRGKRGRAEGDKEPRPMRLSDFDFDLPEHLIAQAPTDARDGSRLLFVPPGDAPFEHLGFGALPSLLNAGDLLVVNDARVVPARLLGHKEGTGGRVELLLFRPSGELGMALALADAP